MKSVLVYLAKKIAVGTRKDNRTNKTQIKSKQKKNKTETRTASTKNSA